MECSLRIQKYKSNPLLQRKQFLVEVSHQGAAPPSLSIVRERLSQIYKISDMKRIVVGGFVTKFGEGVSQGFGRLYDSPEAALKFERNHTLAKRGIADLTVKPNRRQKKDNRIKRKRVRGIAKAKIGVTTKK